MTAAIPQVPVPTMQQAINKSAIISCLLSYRMDIFNNLFMAANAYSTHFTTLILTS